MLDFNFTKMHSLGNDFVMLDGINTDIRLTVEQLRQIADRRQGIGCDQIIRLERSAQADFFMRIFNADGSEVGQCGNGARCLGRFILDQCLSKKNRFEVETISTRFNVDVSTDELVTIELAPPIFEPRLIPFVADSISDNYDLDIEGELKKISAVSMGNPHAVLMVDDVNKAPVETLGKAVEKHNRFPERANVIFVQIENKHSLKLRVWERGVGETFACGSGACAAVAVCYRQKKIAENVNVTLPGGSLSISWDGSNCLSMTGPAVKVFEGRWVL